MNEKRFNGAIERLRRPERVARLEVDRVTRLCLDAVELKTELRTVLDVGVGSGLFAEAFSKQGVSISGVDANPEMLPAAHQYVADGEFRLGLAEALPYADAEFDLVFMGLVLHESDDQLKAMQEARRVANRRVCVLEWPYRENDGFGPPLAHRLSPEKIGDLARQAGFTHLHSTQLNHLVLYCMEP